ncbi:hypothetical protein E5L59_04925 [Helicobacter pylori]|nr:hypothetical protein E5L59_04925 [Helicobacter pylori]
MRQEHETTTSFNQLQAITQAIMLKKGAQTSDNASQSTPKPKGATHAKNHALKPTKRAFSERQMTAFRDNSQASEEKRLKTQQANQQGDNANAFKSDEAFKQGLATQQSNTQWGQP